MNTKQIINTIENNAVWDIRVYEDNTKIDMYIPSGHVAVVWRDENMVGVDMVPKYIMDCRLDF